MNIDIRLANEQDIPDVCKLVQQMSPGFTHDYKNATEKFKNKIQASPDYFLWVAEFEGKIVGTIMMHLQHKLSYHCGTAGHIEDLVIDEKFRGKGIGQFLLHTVIEEAKEHNCYKVILNCFEKTASFYEPFGFKKHDIGMKLELIEPYPNRG